MAQLEFFVVSRAASIDQVTNNMSVFEILEELHPGSFPAFIPTCVAVTLWRREPGDEEQDFQQILRITWPSGNSRDFTSNFRMIAPRHRVTQRIEGLPVEQEGEIRFEAILNGQHAAVHIVDVQRDSPDAADEAPAGPN